MVLTGNEGVTSYDPDTGTVLWSIDGPTEQYVASLVYNDGVFFLTAGFPDYHNMGITPEGKAVLWHESKTTSKKASYVPSPIAVPGHFWMISDTGWLSSFDAQTGKAACFMEQLGRHHSASPVLADGHVYLTDDDGVTHVLKAGGGIRAWSPGTRCLRTVQRVAGRARPGPDLFCARGGISTASARRRRPHGEARP